jgi:hypothetical protein
MSDPLIHYDTQNGELRSIPEAFGAHDDYVASIVWEKKAGDRVTPGERLAELQWGGGNIQVLTAPTECRGVVRTLNRNIIFEELGYEPSQLLALIQKQPGN